MENKLRQLFDYQKFENNAALAKIIEDTESRMSCELLDEDLAYVAGGRGGNEQGFIRNKEQLETK